MTISPGSKARPPLARACREFLANLKLPTECTEGHKDYALLLLLTTMTLFTKNVEDGAESVTCDPSVAQLARLMHASPRQVQRIISRAREKGILTSVSRGSDMSSIFTIHQNPISGAAPSEATPYRVVPETPTSHDNSTLRHDINASQTRQDDVQGRHTTVSSSGVKPLGRSPSGGGNSGAEHSPSPSNLETQKPDYAKEMLAVIGLSERGNLQSVRQAIAAEAKFSSITEKLAFDLIKTAAENCMRAGVTVNAFWFQDAKFRESASYMANKPRRKVDDDTYADSRKRDEWMAERKRRWELEQAANRG